VAESQKTRGKPHKDTGQRYKAARRSPEKRHHTAPGKEKHQGRRSNCPAHESSWKEENCEMEKKALQAQSSRKTAVKGGEKD